MLQNQPDDPARPQAPGPGDHHGADGPGQTGRIDRHAVVARHDVRLTRPDARLPLSVGNGDFAVTVDASGLQTFTALHDPRTAEAEGRQAVNTATLSMWGWHEMPNPDMAF